MSSPSTLSDGVDLTVKTTNMSNIAHQSSPCRQLSLQTDSHPNNSHTLGKNDNDTVPSPSDASGTPPSLPCKVSHPKDIDYVLASPTPTKLHDLNRDSVSDDPPTMKTNDNDALSTLSGPNETAGSLTCQHCPASSISKDVEIVVASPSTTKLPNLNLNQSFSTFAELLLNAQQYATQCGFRVMNDIKHYFTPQMWPFDSPFVSSTPKYGRFICSPKSPGRPSKSKCQFRLVYGWRKLARAYQWNSKTSVMCHCHPLLPPQFKFDGRTEVAYELDLTTRERSYINDLILCRIDVPTIALNLEREFPSRSFTYQLLFRLRKNVLDQKYGKDRSQLTTTFLKGDTIRQSGGIFDVQPTSDDFGIGAIHCQTALMGKYATIYGENGLKMADGTFKMCNNDFVFIFWMVVDCLHRSKFAGYTSCFTENSDRITEGARLFFPNECGRRLKSFDMCEFGGAFFDPFVDHKTYETSNTSISDDPGKNTSTTPPCQSSGQVDMGNAFITDEGPAFSLVAKEFGWAHILDRKHFIAQIDPASRGMARPSAYREFIYDLLDAPTEEEFQGLLESPRRRLFHFTDNAWKLVQKIIDHKDKLVFDDMLLFLQYSLKERQGLCNLCRSNSLT